MDLTREQAEILLANIRLHDGLRTMLWSSEIEETIELWERMKWIKPCQANKLKSGQSNV